MYGGSIMSIRNKKAFTLIEMLVVVLIIGILAAIALPQYRIAVMKTRAAASLSLGKSVQQAISLGELQGTLPPCVIGPIIYDFSHLYLDINVPNISYLDQASQPRYSHCQNILIGSDDLTTTHPLLVFKTADGYYHATGKKGDIFCRGRADSLADKVCKNLAAGTLPHAHAEFNMYKLN
jgi:prepilin-type N-terminal cleavage/methylation domain-containing protein